MLGCATFAGAFCSFFASPGNVFFCRIFYCCVAVGRASTFSRVGRNHLGQPSPLRRRPLLHCPPQMGMWSTCLLPACLVCLVCLATSICVSACLHAYIMSLHAAVFFSVFICMYLSVWLCRVALLSVSLSFLSGAASLSVPTLSIICRLYQSIDQFFRLSYLPTAPPSSLPTCLPNHLSVCPSTR